MRYWVGVLSAFGAGLIVGGVAIRVLVEEKIAQEYDESLASVTHSYEISLNQIKEEGGLFDGTGAQLRSVDLHEGPNAFGEKIVWDAKTKEQHLVETNRYHKPVVEDVTPVNLFVEGTPNQFGISYIEEEDFDEEDGRSKYNVTMVVDPETMDTTFFMYGVVIDDAAQRLGPTILEDFITHVPAELPNQILYVRNHQTDEDYEVVRELP